MNVPVRKKTDRKRPCSCAGCLRGFFRKLELDPGPMRTYELMLVKVLVSCPLVQDGNQKSLRLGQALPVEVQGKIGSFLGLVNKSPHAVKVLFISLFSCRGGLREGLHFPNVFSPYKSTHIT